MTIEIYVDGGCSGNGTSHAKGYGSFMILVDGKKRQHKHFTLPNATTNNQAEYGSLMEVVDYLKAKEVRLTYDITVCMDSDIVVEQVNKRWRAKDKTLKALSIPLIEFFKTYPNIKLIWVGRERIFSILRH